MHELEGIAPLCEKRDMTSSPAKTAFEFGDLSPIRYFAGAAVVLGLLFALLSPEGTTEYGVLAAAFQWLAQAALPMSLATLAHIGLHRWHAFTRLQNPWLKLLASGVAASALFAPAAYGIDLLLGVDSIDATRKASGLALAIADEFAAVVAPVTLTWIALNAPFHAGFRFRRDTPPPASSPVALPAVDPPLPNFMKLIRPDLRGDVIFLKSELHYLTVVTTMGQSLILYTLRDAAAELPTGTGIQIHRSYWANLRHVAAVTTTGRRMTLKMTDGSILAVSRSQATTVEAALANLPAAR